MMRSQSMQALMIEHARIIAEEANSIADWPDWDEWFGYEVPYYDVGPEGEPVTGIVSAHAFVRTGNLAAMVDQSRNDTLNKAL